LTWDNKSFGNLYNEYIKGKCQHLGGAFNKLLQKLSQLIVTAVFHFIQRLFGSFNLYCKKCSNSNKI